MADVVEVLGQLVAFATESRTSNTNLLDYYSDRANAAGAITNVVAGETGPDARANLFVRFGPEAKGGLFLSGHTDVVPAGTGWASNPYELSARDGLLYGRGTADMKGFLAAALIAMTNINVAQLQCPVYVGLSYDEEIGCVGVHHLLDHLRSLAGCQPDIIVVGEPTQMQLCTAHSGKQVYRVEISAPSGHSSRTLEQPTAIEAAGAIVAAVFTVNEASQGDGGGYSTNVGTIHGGIAVNVLAPNCDLDFECRHPANHAPTDLLDPVFATIADWTDRLRDVGGNLTATPTVSYPALSTAPTEPAVQQLRAGLGGVALGQVSFGCEAGLYTEALPAPAVIYGPGNIADAHRPDEYVLARDLEATVSRLSAAVEQFCVQPRGEVS